MKYNKLSRFRLIIFSITSILLIIFQLGVYFKICQYPLLSDVNMWILLVALVWPFLIRFSKNKYLQIILLIIYLLYFAITAGAFIQMMFDSSINCSMQLVIDGGNLSDWVIGPGT